ncbi:DUF6370 family protein [Pedosphaera parvula]|uniref:Uncharacterized protein n=1 Tax=Pedosphaera parvula (strain Ellin514) TaxID=320771 RepID=B9XND6_PEDPL|nr:DUF6370 family protein [Pedosphaera parvula]EEF58595.1 conserved hypothetical protein [Pedosphaera parvula Ellin514]
MKKLTYSLIAGVAAFLMLALVSPVSAADKTVTITGEGKCAKCALKEADKCQNAIQVEKDGKTTTYYLVQNDVSKSFHENICKESKKVTATGTVKTEDGKMMLTADKIEVAK